MTENTDNVVTTVGLTKTFRDFWLREKVTAVRDLDLKIVQGEVYGLLGPNGSGKSTTLKIILGLMFPSGGRVAVFGKPPTDVAGKARIGFLPEESYLYPFLDAWETLDYYGRLFHQSRPERRRRIEMLLDMVGLTGVAYRRVGEYSKGMQRRIGMAQALINDPDLLILDEPTSGMDPLAARQFKDLIAELSRRGKTVILSSHLLADMEDVCDRVGILYAGRLRTEGTLSELLSRRTLTQITTERLEPELTERVRQLLARENKQLLAVESPRDKLEALFLRIVRQARDQGREQLQTAAAIDTGQVAEFLRAPEGQAVIEQLVQPEAPPAPTGAPAGDAFRAAPEPAKDVLADLLQPAAPAKAAGRAPEEPSPAEPSLPAGKPAQSAPAPGAPGPVDRGIIDSLTARSDPEKSDHA